MLRLRGILCDKGCMICGQLFLDTKGDISPDLDAAEQARKDSKKMVSQDFSKGDDMQYVSIFPQALHIRMLLPSVVSHEVKLFFAQGSGLQSPWCEHPLGIDRAQVVQRHSGRPQRWSPSQESAAETGQASTTTRWVFRSFWEDAGLGREGGKTAARLPAEGLLDRCASAELELSV